MSAIVFFIDRESTYVTYKMRVLDSDDNERKVDFHNTNFVVAEGPVQVAKWRIEIGE